MTNEKLIKALHEAEEEIKEAVRSGKDVSKLVTISRGNEKMGKIPSVSLLPVLTCPARCNGTCGEKCYARKLANLRPSVIRSYARNTAIARLFPTDFFRAVHNAMACSRFFRFHVSGDIMSRSYFDMVAYLAHITPYCKILMFTKRFEIVNQFLDDGNTIPENLRILFSGWTNLHPTEEGLNPNRFPETTVYAKGEEPKPEWTPCNGNCLDCALHCGGCWEAKSGQTVAFQIH